MHDDTELVRLQYFAEEAARDDVNFENYENNDYENDIKSDFNKLLQYFRQFLRLLLSVGRLCDDWRRRPIQGTLHFVQRYEQDLTHMSTTTKTLLFMTCMILLMTILRSHFATNVEKVSTQSRTMEIEVTPQHRVPIFQETENILPFLTAETLTRTMQIDGDTREDVIRLRQMQDMDDDLQSQLDLELLQ
eukprot:2362291-Amphidinium_carterae.3